jgi:putative tryptophan/tyrosine transport system substrate-binding protein
VLHSDRSQNRIRNGWTIVLVGMVVVSLLLSGCGGGPKTYTIGMVNHAPSMVPVFEGFKAGMAELGYVEGKNVTYVSHGVLGTDPKAIAADIKSLLDQKVDLLVTVGSPTTLPAEKAVEGTKTPIVFAPVIYPVDVGVVKSISRPGGSATGVQSGNTIAKALEWLIKVAPATKKVYVPYNPKDQVSVLSVKTLQEAAPQLGVELILAEVGTPDELVAAVDTLPKDVQGVFLVTSPSLDPRLSEFSQAAAQRGLAVGAYSHVEDTALVTYTSDTFLIGKQAARMADQVLRGIAPADLPVETAEYFLTINLKTAKTLNLDIPDDVLRQAKTVIR